LSKNFLRYILFAPLTGLIFSLSSAQDSSTLDPLSNVKKCVKVQIDSSRLACFDAAVGELSGAVDTGEVLIIDKEIIEQSKKENFGLVNQDKSDIDTVFEKKNVSAKTENSNLIVNPIMKVEKNARKRAIFYLENGQVWEQTQSGYVYVNKKKQNIAHIKKAALGGFKLRINDKGTLIRVRRIK